MNAKRLKILVTDADCEFLNIADQKLSERGFKVITTSSILESVEFLKTISVDYVMVMNSEDKKLISDFIQTLNKKPIIINEKFEGIQVQKEMPSSTNYV